MPSADGSRLRRALAVAAVVSAAVGVVAGASHALERDGPPIYGCYAANRAGALRLLGGPVPCRSGEQPVSWNLPGPPGPTGPSGRRGPFIAEYELVADNGALTDASRIKKSIVRCPAGKRPSGGGGTITIFSAGNHGVVITQTRPLAPIDTGTLNAAGWFVEAMEVNGLAPIWTLDTWAVCGNL
jgi:hypothetical protein